MINKNFIFHNFLINSKKYKKNLKKTKDSFKSLLKDYENNKLPILKVNEKDYSFNFSEQNLKKFFKYKNIIICGMGGSSLGVKSIYSLLKRKIKRKLFFFDDLDYNLFNKLEKNIFKDCCLIIISKSGNTLETITNLNLIYSISKLKNKIIFITEKKNNVLTNIADKLHAEIIEHKNFIGGRYSVLSETGMLPALLMKLNIKKFKNFKMLVSNKRFISFLTQNVASIYTLCSRGIKNSVILNYSSSLTDLSLWYQQLICESLGKRGKGITVSISKMPKDHHSMLQLYLDGPKDKFFTFLNSSQKVNELKISKKINLIQMNFLKNKNISNLINAQSQAVKSVFKLKKIPFREIVFRKNNEEELGMIFIFFILENILLARLMNVDPFNQPAIEEVKIKTKKILSR